MPVDMDFLCSFCPETFDTKKSLKNHLKSVHSTCEICSLSFKNDYDYLIHKKSAHGNLKFFPCSISGCSYSSDTSEALQMHIRLNHGNDKNFTCKTCSESFFRKHLFNKHLNESYHCKQQIEL